MQRIGQGKPATEVFGVFLRDEDEWFGGRGLAGSCGKQDEKQKTNEFFTEHCVKIGKFAGAPAVINMLTLSA
jgi:hypothetical protein